jgi:hypothetical protein
MVPVAPGKIVLAHPNAIVKEGVEVEQVPIVIPFDPLALLHVPIAILSLVADATSAHLPINIL